MKVYFAAPLDEPSCRRINEERAGALRALGIKVYLPHEHGVGDQILKNSTVSKAEVFKQLYEGDMFGLQTCDCVVAESTKADGHLSAGLLWEIGWATGNGKPVYLIANSHADSYSLMVTNSVSKMFESFEEFLTWFKSEAGGYVCQN